MNKDLYIQLLEEHVDDLTTAMKIDTVLSLRKTEKINGLKSELASVCEERDRFREIIRELKKEKYDIGKKLFDLEKQGVGDSESLQLFRAMEAQR